MTTNDDIFAIFRRFSPILRPAREKVSRHGRVAAAADRRDEGVIGSDAVKLKVIVHEAEEGGYWAEVPAIPGCATQGETFEQLLQNLYEAVEGCLSVDVEASAREGGRLLEIVV